MRRNNMPSRNHGGGNLLRTDHLQLHELDLELELLKRKREMIEHQQQMVGSSSYSRPRPFDYDNNQPQPLFPGLQQYNSPHNNGYGGLLGKRPINDQPWQSYYSGPQGGAKRKFNSAPAPRPYQPKPAAYSGGGRSFPQTKYTSPKIIKKPVHIPKASKPKPAPPSNKNSSYPINEHPKTSVKKTPQTVQSEEDGFILREDKVPSQQLAGRLELALGNILKDIKTKYCTSDNSPVNFRAMFLQRHMKQAIRERLRSVMMGKYVGKVDTIIEQYREVFPRDKDHEIIESVLDTYECTEAMQLALRQEHAGNAFAYIKHNLNRLIVDTLDDMFSKMHKLYADENVHTKDICQKILDEKIPVDKNASLNDTKGSENADENNEDAMKMENNDSKNDNSVSDAKDQKNDEPEVNKDNNEEINTQDGKKSSRRELDTSAKLDHLILTLLRRRLPHILPKYKSTIMKIINVGGVHQLKKTQEFEKKIRNNKKDDQSIERKPPAPYKVKIFGNPHLPSRKTMQTFFNDFKPCSIKKHKTMHVLFVTFRSQDDYERIIAVKETTLDDCTITIKTTERAKLDESKNTTATSLNQSSDESMKISNELDEQINDLLLSIRKEEEDSVDKGQTNKSEVSNVSASEVVALQEAGEEVATPQNGDAEMSVETEQNTENSVETEQNAEMSVETNGNTQTDANVESEEANDRVDDLKSEAKETGRCTPTRSSSRLANVTPSTIRTRRASRLANN